MILKHLFINYYSPEDSNTNSGGTGIQDTIDLLSENDDKDDNANDNKKEGEEEVNEDEKDKSEGIDDKDEDGKDKDEDNEVDEEDEIKLSDEDVDELNIRYYKKKDILKKYPKLFEDFPNLEKAYYSEQQYREIFGNPNTAKKVVARAKVLDEIERDVLSGNITNVLKEVKNVDENALFKIADNYLESLYDVDNKAYFNVVGNLIKRTIGGMVREAKSTKNEDLENAARELSKFVFRTDDIERTDPTKLSKEENKEDSKLKEEKESFRRERFETAQTELSERVDDRIKTKILEHFNKFEDIPEFVRKHAARESMENLEEQLNLDSQFKKYLDKLWLSAEENKFSRASLDRIAKAYLTKAETFLPDILRKARNEMSKGKQTQRKEKDRKGPLPIGRSSASSQNGGQGKTNTEKYKGARSTLDAMNALLD